MSGIWPQVALVLVLVLVNAAFSGSEVALLSLRQGQLRRLQAEGGRGALVAWLARPAVWLLSRATDTLVRLAGGYPSVQRAAVTEEEVRDMVATQGLLTPQQREILNGAFELADRRLRDVLVPRGRVVAVPA